MAQRNDRDVGHDQGVMVSHYEIVVSIQVLIHVVDGKVTGIDPVDGWSEPYIEAIEELETSDGTEETRRWVKLGNYRGDESEAALAPLTGKWTVLQR